MINAEYAWNTHSRGLPCKPGRHQDVVVLYHGYMFQPLRPPEVFGAGGIFVVACKLLYGWLAGRWGSGMAFIGSSLAFAAAHVELTHVILVLPLGLVFGWLRWRSGSLWPSLVAHMANNGLAVVAAAYLQI